MGASARCCCHCDGSYQPENNWMGKHRRQRLRCCHGLSPRKSDFNVWREHVFLQCPEGIDEDLNRELAWHGLDDDGTIG